MFSRLTKLPIYKLLSLFANLLIELPARFV